MFFGLASPLAMRASLQFAINCAFSSVSFLDFLLYIASLLDLNFFSLSSRLDVLFFFPFRLLIWIFRRRVVLLILSIFSGWYVVLSVSVATCTAYRIYLIRIYAREPPFSCFCLKCRFAPVIVCTTFCLFYIFTEVFLPLESYWSLSCDHGRHCIVAMS